jgi:hypothetical protein
MDETVWSLACEAVGWVDTNGWPSVIRVRLVDADGREWHFIDKVPIFVEDLDPTTAMPAPVGILCRVVADDGSGTISVQIDRDRPEAEDGTTRFRVRRDQLSRFDGKLV